ncbi:MAG: hypothetical protein LBM61_02765, partial [Prevotellaceae bacterium]|nr:hypothetical protein [Prevotellaceae bacterium]
MKKILPDCLVILLFAVIATAYFFPAVQEGRILFQHDTAAGAGAGQEIKAYYEQTGERSRWTDALFGGMPTYQISPSYDTDGPLRFVEKLYHLFLPNYIWYAFIMMLGFYILLRAFGISVCLSAIGGILWCFSSYFSILIAAGHLWKYITLAYIPPTIAGIVWAYRGRWWGALVATVFFALQILSNHLQMTYYFLFVILFLVIAFGVDAYYKGQMTKFWRATGILLVAAWIGVAMNLPNLYHTYTYSRHTMRGDNELTSGRTSVSEDGLEKTYITQWSYGIGETVSLLIPNVKGGASVPLSANKDAMKKADPRYVSIYGQLGQYFGEQPGTSGPVYVGAFVLLLFIFGAFIVKGAIKWALLGATLLSILLSWGHNFMPLTDLFIDYVPMYNKFRAVSSILVIAEFTIPLLAILALKEILVHPAVLKEKKAL